MSNFEMVLLSVALLLRIFFRVTMKRPWGDAGLMTEEVKVLMVELIVCADDDGVD